MAGNFSLRKFKDIDLNDPFFDSLKKDYPLGGNVKPFEVGFPEKAQQGRTALVFNDEYGIGAFVCIKHEAEPIILQDRTLPRKERCKITTVKIAERFRGQRIGEGAIGLVLWKWKELRLDDIYVTVFDKHTLLITQLTKFGFIKVGYNLNGEGVYLRSRSNVNYTDPYKSFPFINPNFENAGYLCVNDYYHDTLFPYSELKNTLQTSLALNVKNGLSKIYVGAQYTVPPYKIGEPIFIYRIHNGNGVKRYKSCLTSYCIVTDVIAVKKNSRCLMAFDELISRIGNKSVYDVGELRNKYIGNRNMFVIEMLYYGYFGEGNNINMDSLENNGHWSKDHGNSYPALIRLTPEEFREILREGNIDVDNVIID